MSCKVWLWCTCRRTTYDSSSGQKYSGVSNDAPEFTCITQVPNKKDFADTNDNSTANISRSSTQNPNKKDFDAKYIRG